MSRLPHFHFAVFLAAVHLLLFSFCPVSSDRIYETNDAVVIEVDDARASNLADQPSTRSARSSNFGNPAAPIPMPYVVNPYTGLYQQQQPNIPFWPYPLLKPASSNGSNVEDDEPANYPGSRQQNIACGAGASSPMDRADNPERIVNGFPAKRNAWPFVVGLKKAGTEVVYCGGSLISPTRILTAANCVEKLSFRAIKTMSVSLGMTFQGSSRNPHNAEQVKRVTRAVYHKDYNARTRYNDIAVLTIDPPVFYSKAVSPICLPPTNTGAAQLDGKDAVIMGWGTQRAIGGQAQLNLQQAIIQIYSDEQCKTLGGGYSTLKQQLCAVSIEMDFCTYDFGGPMVSQLKDGSTTWTQVGINSRTFCSGNAKSPSIYTNVASFRNWINTYMND